ncbi:hypothetical protein [Mycobacteroides abscessus]|uniref:hypothetical protein n=1 Tax=Mycobacteroides abscessus TaxID=36809 RepID=UPI0009A73706|nr:hypothetical protein [Mycobacteroides abscessus]RIT49742.1 hypothetical protein D2E80_10560 [Mycobacteroides abscessus]
MTAIVPHPFTNEFQTIRLYRLDEEVFDVLPLTGVNVVSLAINLPGPAACARLAELEAIAAEADIPLNGVK